MYKNFSKVYDYFMEHCEYELWIDQIYFVLNKYEKESGTLIDIGCGTGSMLQEFSNKYSCVGLDLSEKMLEIAHKKLKKKKVALFKGDMVLFDVGSKFDIAVSLFDTVNHLTSNEDLLQHLCTVKATLNSGGIYIFDVIDRNFMNKMFKGGVFADNRKKMSVIWEHEIQNDLDYIDATYFVKNKMGTYDKLEETYEKKIFTEEEIKDAIKASNLTLKEVVLNKEIAGERNFYVVMNEG
ncbi:MAG: class I SAM-dependent DNA methyltransferase [Fusobacteriaceae bacterium]